MLLRFIDSTLLAEWTVQTLIVDQTHLVLVSGFGFELALIENLFVFYD